MSRQAQKDAIVTMKNVVSDYIFSSDFYLLKNWVYDFSQEKTAAGGYNDCLCFVIVKKGAFLFSLSKESHDMHSGHIIIEKPDYEYRLRPCCGECTIYNFSEDFYQQYLEDMNLKKTFFFANQNILSLVLRASPECEFLQFQILQKARVAGKLEMDNLVIELLNQIVGMITQIELGEIPDTIVKPYHLTAVEQAKEYIHHHFAADLSLKEIATHSCVSPFHFNRIFKKITSFTPQQYLQNIRLKHGELLLKNTSLPVADIAFSSGFSTAEYFATSFKQRYKASPLQYRNR